MDIPRKVREKGKTNHMKNICGNICEISRQKSSEIVIKGREAHEHQDRTHKKKRITTASQRDLVAGRKRHTHTHTLSHV